MALPPLNRKSQIENIQVGEWWLSSDIERSRKMDKKEILDRIVKVTAKVLANSGRLKAIARAGASMPQKSTFFYPKLATGMILKPLS